MRRDTLRRAMLLLCTLGCSSRFWAASSGTYTCEAAVSTNTCGRTYANTSREVTLQGGGTDVMSLEAPASSSINGSGPWGSVQFGAQADPEAYSSTGGMSCGGAWVTYTQRAALTSVGTGRVTMTVSFDYGPTAAACGGAAGCRLVYDVTCTRVR